MSVCVCSGAAGIVANGPDPREANLSCMSVATHVKLDVARRGIAIQLRCVRKQNLERSARNRGQRTRQIVAFVAEWIVDSSQPNGRMSLRDINCLIDQHADSHVLQGERYFRDIVIAENSEDAVLG